MAAEASAEVPADSFDKVFIADAEYRAEASKATFDPDAEGRALKSVFATVGVCEQCSAKLVEEPTHHRLSP